MLIYVYPTLIHRYIIHCKVTSTAVDHVPQTTRLPSHGFARLLDAIAWGQRRGPGQVLSNEPVLSIRSCSILQQEAADRRGDPAPQLHESMRPSPRSYFGATEVVLF